MNVADIMFALFRYEFFKTELSDEQRLAITTERLPALFALSKRYDMAHLVAMALHENGLLNGKEDIHARFVRERQLAIMRYEQIRYEYEQICELLEAEKMEYIPLKGAVLRGYYPEPWMRTSCDIDVFVHEEELDKAAAKLVEKLGYTCEWKRSVNELSLHSPGGVHLELHYDLTEEGRFGKEILSDIWKYTERQEGSMRASLSDPAFYYYHVVHMMKHFQSGGCGIRPFLDLRVLESIPHNEEGRRALLEQGGALCFAEAAEKLSRVWFLGEEHNEMSKRMEEFLLQAGMYGDFENRKAVEKEKIGGKKNYLLSRIFLPNKLLKKKYPQVAKSPWKAPFYQIVRWWSLLFNKKVKDRTAKEIRAVSNKNKARQKAVYQLMKDLEIC